MRESGARTVVVFASASLGEAFEATARSFEDSEPGVDVVLHTAGTPRLVLQLREGAEADVFASADTVQMERVVALGRAASKPRVFAGNSLALAVRSDLQPPLAGIEDLARDGLRVLLCGPKVPAGRYARQALGRAGVAAVGSRSDEPNVRALLAKIELGEADAGIVYATDARRAGVRPASSSRASFVTIEPEHNVTVQCPIVALRRDDAAKPKPSADAFLAFVRSPRGQSILASHGFQAP
ncbi:MAG: molybdate ABC transporter substrate-binding protein [Planctomycetota bacterium]